MELQVVKKTPQEWVNFILFSTLETADKILKGEVTNTRAALRTLRTLMLEASEELGMTPGEFADLYEDYVKDFEAHFGADGYELTEKEVN